MATREKIIEAALRLAAAQGLSSLSVRSVAAAAGVGATTLRHYFPTQAELHLVVATELARRPVGDLSIADDRRDPSDRLFECLAQLLPPNGRRAAVEGWFELHRMSASVPEARSIVEGAQRSLAERVRRWLAILAVRGHLRPEDVDGYASSALALVNGLYVRALFQPGQADPDAAKNTIRWFAERVVDRRPAP
ncbi:TetR family transcriptional regulator C-terminal domain-containing protein [Amycolatopsis saalfeldensis]|uniref:DNA-binding transcriptional regulator, AcrR family n=1 Tax=Amycolatopsis saalfeldensis TaxID=394193 RepID=A0A1H8YMU6_9PSEU|nr:TetR family transcriptional regulator C-terminal domain-containing protein [Amycolatopsis saalfeldensis]SEP53510.1 DNA-binding transcriptional regulator, AcrR family [Amycolatopsis saalfeldensis]